MSDEIENPDNDNENVIHVEPLFEEKYNQRTQKARVLKGVDESLAWINESFAATFIKGKFKILWEKNNGQIDLMEKSDFVALMKSERITITSPEDGKSKSMEISELWLKWSGWRIYENGITFDPSYVGHRDGFYNMWKGWPIVPRQGDCNIFLNYMKDIICNGDKGNFEYLEALISQMFQEPWLKPGIAVVMRGDEGVGKSFFVEKIGALVGPYYFKTSNPDYIFGNHNGQLKDKLLMHLEEAVWAGSKKEESSLKDLITGPTLQINDKFMPLYDVPNHLHIFITGNPEWLVAASSNARRLFALHVSNARRVDTEYFAALDNWFIKQGGASALMYHFMNYKININLRHVPHTDELLVQKKKSADPVMSYMLNIAETGEMPYGELMDLGKVKVIKKLIYQDFLRSASGKKSTLTEINFGIAFLALLPLIVNGEVQRSGKGRVESIVDSNQKCEGTRKIRFGAYILPSIDVFRELIDFTLRGKSNWNDEKEWTILRGNNDENEDIYGPGRF